MSSHSNRNAGGTSRIGLWQLLDGLLGHRPSADDLDGPVTSDAVTFRHDTRMGYAPTDVARCSADGQGNVTVSASLLGPVGTGAAMPLDITESVLSADDNDGTVDFFDVFHSRAMQVVHAAYRTFGAIGTENLRRGLRSFTGEDAFSIDAPTAAPEELFGLGVSDVLHCQPEHVDVAGFEVLLGRAFPELGARVSLGDSTFAAVPAADKTPLGIGRNVLGRGMTYGPGIWNPVGTLRISTREFSDVSALLPDGPTYTRLSEFSRQWVSRCREVELDVPMPGAQASWMRLDSGRGMRLGYDTQLAGRRPEKVRMRVKVVTASPTVAVRYAYDE